MSAGARTRVLGLGKRLLGLEHGGDRYRYVDDPVRGPVHESRAADRWVRTTCGYSSVGCGLLLGVKSGMRDKDDKVVTVAGDPAHPVNRGRLCPQGLSEPHILAAPVPPYNPTVRPEDSSVGQDSSIPCSFRSAPNILKNIEH